MPERYPLRNAAPDEAGRLRALQELHDASTHRRLERLGITRGWDCAELGAGAGSVARWMAEQVGPTGTVTAVDRDTALLDELGRLANVTVRRADLCTADLGRSRFDLVHSRSVLMHLDDPGAVVAKVVRALRPGGVVLLEEADGAPIEALSPRDLPPPFRAVMVPLAARWTWARSLAGTLRSLGLVDVHDDVRQDLLRGATPGAAFWSRTLRSVRPLLTARRGQAPEGHDRVDDEVFDAMLALLEDPDFAAPFAARHRVSGRFPG